MQARPWAIDPGLARELAAAIGWSGDDGIGALARRIPQVLPCGSTAKLAAVAAGSVPPGADVDELAAEVVALLDEVRSAPPGGARAPSWSCWVTATVMAALVEAAGVGPVRVAALRRFGEGTADVDLHAGVFVGEGDDGWLCDPYFGTAIAAPTRSVPETAADADLWSLRAGLGDDERPVLDLWSARSEQVLHYRLFAPVLDRGDVHAICAVSTTHSGVPLRPYARLNRPDGLVEAREPEGGGGRVDRWTASGRGDAPATRAGTDHPTWAHAVDDFAARTGIRIT